jgi:DNA uptake protein ComE-like DNA-binding protein
MPTTLKDTRQSRGDLRHDGLLIVGLLLAVHSCSMLQIAGSGRPPTEQHGAARLRIDPNAATADELMLLPGIGPALSSYIVEFRESSTRQPAFLAADDLDGVHRIGPLTVEKLRPFLTFTGVTGGQDSPGGAAP